jgi:hypothetical protein
MTNKQTTAVQFLIEKLDANLDIKHSWRTKQYIEEAKAIERKQIEDAYNQDLYGGLGGFRNQKFNDGSDYFTSTFTEENS